MQLGMSEKPVFLSGRSIFSLNMDIITMRKIMRAFLRDLKKEGLLLTQEEFSKFNRGNFISKGNDIGRIQGKNFIEKLVMENGLKHIKVPKKIAVLNEGVESVSFRVARSTELIPEEDQLTIYAERIEPVNRKLSLEEALEFMIILEKTGYGDFWGQNFFFAKDGIYFIDTEFKDFSPFNPNFNGIEGIKHSLDPKDVDKFLVEFQKRKALFENEKETREAQIPEYRAFFKNPYKSLIRGYRENKFTFHLDSLKSERKERQL